MSRSGRLQKVVKKNLPFIIYSHIFDLELGLLAVLDDADGI